MAKKADPNSNPQKPPQKSADLAPVLHPVTGVVVTHHMLVSVAIFADDGQGVHIYSGALELLHGSFRVDMGGINSYHRVLFRHFQISFG
jgi:hypothetical protein